MKKHLSVFFVLISACTACVPTASDYKVGDCLVYDGSENTFKVLEVGKHGLRVLKPYYDGFQELTLDPKDISKSHKMDCLNMFEVKGS